jgi:chaperone modulatory protein CbpM
MSTLNKESTNSPDLIEQNTLYSVHDFCEICRIRQEVLVELIREGVILPQDPSDDTWVFTQRTVTRFKRAYRLQRDLDLNLSGVALSVELLEEIDQLNEEIALLKSKLRMI